jgi:hypothetical protein
LEATTGDTERNSVTIDSDNRSSDNIAIRAINDLIARIERWKFYATARG